MNRPASTPIPELALITGVMRAMKPAGTVRGGFMALGVVLPQTLALVGIAYAPLAAVGMAPNPLWCLWSAMAGALLMAALTRDGAAIYGVRPSAALLYGSTLAVCVGLAPTLKLSATGVLGMAAATMMMSAAVIWLAVRSGATMFARYLPAPVGKGLTLGIGLSILWSQLKAVGAWFVDPAGRLVISALVVALLLVLIVRLALLWRQKYPTKPYLLAVLPVAAISVWVVEQATSMPFAWVTVPPIRELADLFPPALAGSFAFELLATGHLAPLLTALTVLAAQALFVAFTFIVDTAGNAATLEQTTGTPYDAESELRACALAMAVLPWFGLLPVGSNVSATRPILDTGQREEQVIRSANAVVALGLAVVLGLALLGLDRVPVLFIVAALIVIGYNMLEPSQLRRPGSDAAARQLWWQTWLIGLIFLFTSGVFAMVAGFAVAVAQLVRGADGAVIRSTYNLHQLRSRRWRTPEEEAVLRRVADRLVVVVLQGNASFAVARRIRDEISRVALPGQVDVLLIDAARVVQWDLSALDSFMRMGRELRAGKVDVILSHPTDEARESLARTARLFADTDRALEWAENELIRRQGMEQLVGGRPLASVAELPLCARMSETARESLAVFGRTVSYTAGQVVFNASDSDATLMALLSGNVSIELEGHDESVRVATFLPGMVFGEMSFLDGSVRSARAVAVTPSVVFCLPRDAFVAWAKLHPQDAQRLLNGLAAQIAQRLRFTTSQLIALNP